MNKQLQQAMWLQGNSRHFLGPNVTALVPLNLLAAAFTHSHSDASMRILLGYSYLGLVFLRLWGCRSPYLAVRCSEEALVRPSSRWKYCFLCCQYLDHGEWYGYSIRIAIPYCFGCHFCGQLLFNQSHTS